MAAFPRSTQFWRQVRSLKFAWVGKQATEASPSACVGWLFMWNWLGTCGKMFHD